MNLRKNALDYTNVLKYLLLFFIFLVFSKLEQDVYPYSTAVLVSSLGLGSSPLITGILFVCSFLLFGQTGLLAHAGIASFINIVVFLIYKKLKIQPKAELILFAIVSMIAYLILGDTNVYTDISKRIYVSIITVMLTAVLYVTGDAILKKGLKFKLSTEEFACITLSVVILGLGICHIFLAEVWKSLSVLTILMCAYLFNTGKATLISATLGISLAIYYANVNYVSCFLIWGLFAEWSSPLSRYVSAVAVTFSDYLLNFVFRFTTQYSLAQFLPVVIGAVVFCLIPNKPLKKLKEKLYSFREKQLTRQAINRNRIMVSNRLYELSGVFTEMASAFNAFRKKGLTEERAKIVIEKKIKESVCSKCDNCEACYKKNSAMESQIAKMIDIGFAKGKLSLIDLPRELSEKCLHPNNILYGMNKLLGEYRNYLLQNANLLTGRKLIADEATGVAEILRSLALETGSLLKYQSRLERQVSESLLKNGFPISELLIYGEQERLSIGIVIPAKEIAIDKLARVVSSTLKIPMHVTEKVNITEEKFYIHLHRSVVYDAIFGLSKATKDGSEISGDTHSVTRINEQKFLVALSDGMGSGKQAETIASTSLSLIESFYKSGLNGTLILNTVNKLLAINSEESFTALDVSVIDLKTCSADFIKYGSPYGFIINENGVKIVEGNSLPLGILEELKPAVCNAQLSDGDMILLVTDGISDAFGSSGDIIDYLRTAPAKNPQALTDGILEQAVKLNGGKHKDDMTALAVRIYKKTS